MFVTMKFSDHMCCPGMMHAFRCLKKLVSLADALNRTAIFPRPYEIMSIVNNDNIPLQKDWSRYITVPVSQKMPEYEISQTFVSPSTPWKELLTLQSDMIVLDFTKKEWKHRESDCFQYKVAKINYSKQVFEPSQLVMQHVMRIKNNMGAFNMMHVRRGRILLLKSTTYSHGHCGTQNLRRVTSPSYITDFYNKSPANKSIPLIIMSNEKDNDFYWELKQKIKNVLFENSLFPEWAKKDQYFIYQTMLHLGKFAEYKVSTTPSCYLKGGCHRNLCEKQCTCT